MDLQRHFTHASARRGGLLVLPAPPALASGPTLAEARARSSGRVHCMNVAPDDAATRPARAAQSTIALRSLALARRRARRPSLRGSGPEDATPVPALPPACARSAACVLPPPGRAPARAPPRASTVPRCATCTPRPEKRSRTGRRPLPASALLLPRHAGPPDQPDVRLPASRRVHATPKSTFFHPSSPRPSVDPSRWSSSRAAQSGARPGLLTGDRPFAMVSCVG